MNSKLEQFGKMLCLKWNLKKYERYIHITPFKTKITFNTRNKETAIEIHLIATKGPNKGSTTV